MKRRLAITGTTLFLVVLVAVLLAKPTQEEDMRLERGEYLVGSVAMCVQCHTPRNARGEIDQTKLFRGAPIPVKAPFKDQQWAFRAPDIAGLPGWTPRDAVRLLETGHRASGISPKAPMPTYRLTRTDAEAVVAYLKSLR